ncbi:MAG: hypothetical protein LBC40_03320, partial [Dysgonamonadaceae bacterium]|nr:hypothetical protein [Dysgonamonadaceae bacterium]
MDNAVLNIRCVNNEKITDHHALLITENTPKGLSVYETVKDKRIADVAMTGNWENALAQIERGELKIGD